jgi:septal ring factor EnvC (AmiA/AmiB activator)
MTQPPSMDDEWFSVNLESKMNQKIDALQALVHEQMKMIQTLSDEIKVLKWELHSTHHQSTTQNDRTYALLEELTVIKQRELNIMLREKIPVPFVQTSLCSRSLSQPLLSKITL